MHMHRAALIAAIPAVVGASLAGASPGRIQASAATSPTFLPGLPLVDAGGSNTTAAEPSIRVDPTGTGLVYVSGPAGVPTGGCPFWRIHPASVNSAGSRSEYLGRFDTDHAGAGGGDCDIAVGGIKGASGNLDNLAVSSLSLANLTTNQSADHGDTFHTPANSASVQSTGVDRQWNAVDNGLGLVYMTVHDSSANILVSVSTDGGYTYTSNSTAITPTQIAFAANDNHFGTLVVNPANHHLYIPFTAPTTPNGPETSVYIADGNPCAVTCTAGLPPGPITWTNTLVSAGDGTSVLAHDFPAIAIDAGGTVYVGWTDTRHVRISHMTTPASSASWTSPATMDSASEHSTMFPWLVGGRAGTVDAVFYGSTLGAPGASCPAGTIGANDDSSGVNNNCNSVWTVRFAQSTDGGATFTDNPASGVNHRGSICDQGLNCQTSVPAGDRTLLDFFSIDVDTDGAANIAYTQDPSQIVYTRQCTGTSATTGAALNLPCGALAPVISPAVPQCSGAHVITDPAGDATDPAPGGGDASTADITDVSFSSAGDNVTTTMTLNNLSTTPMQGTGQTTYYVTWAAPDGKQYATSETLPDPGGGNFSYGPFDPASNQLTTSSPAVSGSFTTGPGGSISITVPRSGIGSPTIPVGAGGTPAVRSPYAVTIAGEGAAGGGLVFTKPADRGPSSGVGAAWSVCGGAALNASSGYWLVASDGGIFPFGRAGGYGSTGNIRLNQPVVGMASTAQADGYWLVAADGGIFPFGGAAGYGSTGGIHLNRPIVGMARTPSGHGYWLVASDGGIFPFGDAGGYGSTGSIHLNRPVVGMAATISGHGYWLVASDGGIFPFGDAAGYGSTGGIHLNQPIVGMAATASGHGYWLVASDGGIFPFGDAAGYGSTGGIHLNQPIVGMAATPTGRGYWLAASDGGIFPFGDAIGWGSTGNVRLNRPMVGIAGA